MQPLTGWTGQTRRLMWTGPKYQPVRVKMTSLNEEDYLSLSLLVSSLPFLSLHTAMFYNERQISKQETAIAKNYNAIAHDAPTHCWPLLVVRSILCGLYCRQWSHEGRGLLQLVAEFEPTYDIRGDRTGCSTGNGGKLSNS